MSTWQNTLGLTRPAPDTSPGPLDWRVGAPCYNPGIHEDDDPFFHPDGETGKLKRERDHLAKRICANCPLAARCLQFAIENGEQYGVWGGMSEDERLPLIRAARQADREAGIPRRKAFSCGTEAGYRAHKRAGTEPCAACRGAMATYQRERRSSGKRDRAVAS